MSNQNDMQVLRKALWEILKPLITLITNLINPNKGEEWLRELKKFNRKEECWGLKKKTTKFCLGEISIGSIANDKLTPNDVLSALSRHERGDWGDICDSDRETNEESLDKGLRLFSLYYGESGIKFWIITESNFLQTRVLIPDEY
jgi:hypothetical protein